ncbi:DUF4902 domain-containing protein [Rugamonas sp. CCM 8940]|uniref:DUF4902 domain-containing protein n=1 Tax=Rugamonas sp. CCM 8940 TaxID=2765359 RepID=UPI0018F58A18|nr:DUF4902 domain-containing protein [Rugamonas sp. CCM 8940]MBJ7309522.1 DUF4902 domain-containing protein [Rugamonas sp. CCM 8940]
MLSTTPHCALSVSADGYVRLSLPELEAITLSHLMSCLDEQSGPRGMQAAVATDLTGYTEWVSAGWPAISLGWDWQLASGLYVKLCRLHAPRSNVMLVDDSSRVDHGQAKTATLLEFYIDHQQWQAATLAYLSRPPPARAPIWRDCQD